MFDVSSFFFKEIGRTAIVIRSGALAFNFLLAFFPATIFLFTLLPYVPIEGFDLIFFNFIQEIMPEKTYEAFYSTVLNLVSIPRGGLLSLGFILAVYFSSNGVMMMMTAFDKAYPTTFKKRNFFKKRIIALGLTVLMASLLGLSIALVVAGNKFLRWIFEATNVNHGLYTTFFVLKWVILLMLFYSVISLLYKFGPPLKTKFNFWTPGALLATLLSLMSSVIFSFVINNFGRFDEFYGSIGALIVTMIWLRLNASILLIGYELNVSIAVSRDLRRISEEELDLDKIEEGWSDAE